MGEAKTCDSKLLTLTLIGTITTTHSPLEDNALPLIYTSWMDLTDRLVTAQPARILATASQEIFGLFGTRVRGSTSRFGVWCHREDESIYIAGRENDDLLHRVLTENTRIRNAYSRGRLKIDSRCNEVSLLTRHQLLGATGSTGSATLHYLLETRPKDLRLNIFVRNKAKLLAALPQLEQTSSPEIHIYVAPITDHQTLSKCLSGAEVIYNCIADNKSKRGMDIAQQAAASIIEALKQLGTQELQEPPVVLMNRTMYWNETVDNDMSSFERKVAIFFLYYVYTDIKKAELLYRHEAEQPKPILSYILMDGPGLHDSTNMERTGHQLVLTHDKVGKELNYADFGAAWVEAGSRKGELRNREVAVNATGNVRTEYLVLLGYLWQGLLARILPW